jgi:hypothetical protein
MADWAHLYTLMQSWTWVLRMVKLVVSVIPVQLPCT